jgi:hypothetical protein
MTDEEKKVAEKVEAEKVAKEKENKEKLEAEAKAKESTIPYDRFKEMVDEKNKYKAELDKKEQEKTETEKKKLEEQGKYQEAAELAEKRAKEAEEKAVKAETDKKNKMVEFEIGLEAKNQGITDVSDAARLIDLTKVIIDDNGSITGVKEVIETLKKDKPYLFGDNKLGVHTDHAKGAAEMSKEELLKDPIAMTTLRKENRAAYDKIMEK